MTTEPVFLTGLSFTGYTSDLHPRPCWAGDIDLDRPLTLLAGPSGTGKSLVLDTVWAFTGFLEPIFDIDIEGRYSNGMQYSATLRDGSVHAEQLVQDGKLLVQRHEPGHGKVWCALREELVEVGLQPLELAIQSKRDWMQHPFLEDLHAEQVYRTGKLGHDYKLQPSLNHVAMYQCLTVDQKQQYLEDLQALGLPVTRVETGTRLTDIETRLEEVLLYTDDQGRQRALEGAASGFEHIATTLLGAAYTASKPGPGLLLLDGAGEPLDVERAGSLVELLLARADAGDFRVLMTSHAYGTLNAVPLDAWVGLRPTFDDVEVLSEKTHPDLWRDFRATGAPNFDFYASSFNEPS